VHREKESRVLCQSKIKKRESRLHLGGNICPHLNATQEKQSFLANRSLHGALHVFFSPLARSTHQGRIYVSRAPLSFAGAMKIKKTRVLKRNSAYNDASDEG
jgi:hypothetical protein